METHHPVKRKTHAINIGIDEVGNSLAIATNAGDQIRTQSSGLVKQPARVADQIVEQRNVDAGAQEAQQVFGVDALAFWHCQRVQRPPQQIGLNSLEGAQRV